MKYRTLFDGEKIPVLGLGTWGIGGKQLADSSRDREWITSIKTALGLGYSHIDTAEMYGNGHAEELVGMAISGYNRKKLFITTKVCGEHLDYQLVLQANERSLNRLRTDFIDLYLIHWPTEDMDLKATFDALNELVKKRKVRYIGVSNFVLADLKRAQKLSGSQIVTNQVHYNLLVREPEQNGVLTYCQENNIFITVYQPIERGDVLGIPLVQKLAKKYKKTPAQIALNWLMNNPNVITIPMSTKKEHLQENLDALEFEMAPKDLKKLSEVKG